MEKMADKPPLCQAFQHPAFLVGWHDFVFRLPLGWELARYSMLEDSGQMFFSSEDGPKAQLSWRRVKAVPNIEMILAEINRRSRPEIKEDQEVPELTFVSAGIGIIAYAGKGERFYASIFLEEARLLAEWIFPDFEPDKLETIQAMIGTFRPNLPNDRGFKTYGAMGLELQIPSEYHLTALQALPAAITMSFENKKHNSIHAHRWGMAGLLLRNDSILNFYHRILYQRKHVIKDACKQSFFGYEGAEITFRTRGKIGFDFLLGSWWRGLGTSFFVPEENRIYAVEHVAPHLRKLRYTANDLIPKYGSSGGLTT